MNDAACKIAKEVAEESSRDILVAGCLSETFAYTGPDSKEDSDAEFAVQVKCFIENDVDFVVAEVSLSFQLVENSAIIYFFVYFLHFTAKWLC